MKFESWLKEHNYKLDENKYDLVFQNWKDNEDYINEVNLRNVSYTLGHNKYSGMSSLELVNSWVFKITEYI